MHVEYISRVFVLVSVAVTAIRSQEVVFMKGGYMGEDVYLPCMPNSVSPESDREAVWWDRQGIPIGNYSEGAGFQPSGHPDFSGKFNMESLIGDLLIYEVNKTEDDVHTYRCGIIFEDGTNFTDTDPVELVIGYEPHDYHIETNGTTAGSCYSHIGLGPVTCSIVSDPQAEVSWHVDSVTDGDDCQDAVINSNTSCKVWNRSDGGVEYNCSSTFTPNRGCYGSYICRVEYTLGDINELYEDCIFVAEYGDLWFIFYIVLVTLALVLVVVVIVVVLVCIGTLSCAVCAGAVCAASGLFACCKCCKDKNNINPEAGETAYVPTYSVMDGGQMSISQKGGDEPPPAYSYQ